MKSWKMRLGLVLTMLAMVLVASIPAVADNDRDCINRGGDRYCEVDGDRDFDRSDFREDCDDDDDCDIEEFFEDCDEDGDEEDCDFDEFDEDDFGFFDGSDIEVDNLQFVCGDNDFDGSVDEDTVDGLDNDLDGLFDEDENLFECDELLLVAEVELDD